MTPITTLDVSDNPEVSDETISSLTSLVSLSLGNRVRRIKLSTLTDLKELRFTSPLSDFFFREVPYLGTQITALDYRPQDSLFGSESSHVKMRSFETFGRIITKLPNLTKLKSNTLCDTSLLTSLRSLKLLDTSLTIPQSSKVILSALQELQMLSLVRCHEVTADDLSGLNKLTKLRLVHIDLKYIPKLNLKELTLESSPVDDHVSELVTLKKLTLSHCPYITPAGILPLTNLEELTLSDCPKLLPRIEEVKKAFPELSVNSIQHIQQQHYYQ